jgi:hypothetical protein
MNRIPEDKARKERIAMEAIVDAYDLEEVALGWYYYLDNHVSSATDIITARCVTERAISPLQVGDEVEILEMAPVEECRYDMFVMIRWGTPAEKQGLGVPLSQLEILRASQPARQAIEDWHYWVGRGYQL